MSDVALFIVEGEKAEPRFLGKLYKSFVGNRDSKFHVYSTNLHVLVSSLFTNGDLDEDLDLLRVLRERDPDDEILYGRYTDVYLVFDMDPHDKGFNPERIRKMLNHFDDSSDNGKLFINYPMLESFRHLRSLDDEEYVERKISISDVPEYKRIVDMECLPQLKQLNTYDEKIFSAIIARNLEKAGVLLDGRKEISMDDYLSWGNTDLFDVQCEELCARGLLYVLNTSVFIVVDYNPSVFFSRYESG